MNKRQYKKKIKKIENYIENNFDILDKNGNYKTIPIKCYSCEFFESGDYSVGLTDGCMVYALYDENDNIIEKIDKKISFHMSNLGYTCPYFKKIIENKKSN